MCGLIKIQEALRNYKQGDRRSIADLYFGASDRMMTWQINNLCNFDCPYCGHYTKDDPDVYKYSPQHIADCFNKTGDTWHIIITGGEPFLHKYIIEICKLLTEKHYISINTNLSQQLVRDFADIIDPARVVAINASIHFAVRTERKIMDEYIDNYLYFQHKGFNIIGSYVVFPTDTIKFADDIAWLYSRGLKQISSKVFEGEFNGKLYPDAYTDFEIEKITAYMSSEIEMPQYLKYRNFKGLHCSTGRKMLSLKPNGDIERCLSEYTLLGNFFSGNFKLPKKDKKCKTDICTCPYQGMLFTYRKRGIF